MATRTDSKPKGKTTIPDPRKVGTVEDRCLILPGTGQYI